jgi:hypothetical protein
MASAGCRRWKATRPKKRKFKAYPIGYFHIDIAEVRTEEGKLHLYAAIDRTSKFAFAQLRDKADRPTADLVPEGVDRGDPASAAHDPHR